MKGIFDFGFWIFDFGRRTPEGGASIRCTLPRSPAGGSSLSLSTSHFSLVNARRAFTLIEVLVATAVTALIAGLMITVISNVMSTWRRSADSLQTNSQAKIALEYLAADLNGALFRRDRDAWLIATVQPDQTTPGDVGGSLPTWTATGGGVLKPGWADPGTATSSLNLAPASGRLEDCRFGMAGVWLRLICGVADSNVAGLDNIQQTSAPRAVGYQVVRHRLADHTGAAIRYALFRTEVRPFHRDANPQAASTFVIGYNLNATAYTSGVGVFVGQGQGWKRIAAGAVLEKLAQPGALRVRRHRVAGRRRHRHGGDGVANIEPPFHALVAHPPCVAADRLLPRQARVAVHDDVLRGDPDGIDRGPARGVRVD